MKDIYYEDWLANKEKDDRRREQERMLEDLQFNITLFMEQKKKEFAEQLNSIVVDVGTRINGKAAPIEGINDTIRELVIDALRKGF